MNKKQVNEWIPSAKTAVEEFGIAKSGKVDNRFRGYISSFGAAVVLGSLKSAAAFLADDGGSEIKRSLLICAMYKIIKGETAESAKVFDYICNHDNRQTKEDFINASIALKLSLNYFELVKNKKDTGKKGEA